MCTLFSTLLANHDTKIDGLQSLHLRPENLVALCHVECGDAIATWMTTHTWEFQIGNVVIVCTQEAVECAPRRWAQETVKLDDPVTPDSATSHRRSESSDRSVSPDSRAIFGGPSRDISPDSRAIFGTASESPPSRDISPESRAIFDTNTLYTDPTEQEMGHIQEDTSHQFQEPHTDGLEETLFPPRNTEP